MTCHIVPSRCGYERKSPLRSLYESRGASAVPPSPSSDALQSIVEQLALQLVPSDVPSGGPSAKMRRWSCSTCCPPFPQIVRDRAGGCLTISAVALPKFSWSVIAQPASKRGCTRVGMCLCKEPFENHRSTMAGTMLHIDERGFSNETTPSFSEGRSTSSLAVTAQNLLEDVFDRTREVFHGTRDGSTFQGSSRARDIPLGWSSRIRGSVPQLLDS